MDAPFYMINYESDIYPSLLKKIPSPPKKLFTKGEVSGNIFQNCVAIVGSRKMSLYGERVVNYIIEGLRPEITIVSGFMYGVDTGAHRAALKTKIKTIAVLPAGVDNVIPSSNGVLYNEIIQNGSLILSEWEGNIEPKNWSFPRRNRIIAGLSRAVIVVEAARESGSLITADYARKFGRKVFSVPGSIFSTGSQGTCELIKNGAELLYSPTQINNFLFGTECAGINAGPKEESELYGILLSQPLNINELTIVCKKSVPQISAELLRLQMEGKVKCHGGVYHAC